MTPGTLRELFESDPSEITFEGDIYAINHSLRLPPWMPPVCNVWALKDDRPEYEPADRWNQTLTMLNELNGEFERRNND